MTIRHMRIYIQVYQMQNITKAAQNLHMTQPAVTRAIQELENYYGVCLFERINRRLSVTEVGKRLYSQALHIVDAFDRMEKSMQDWDTFGILRVGASITLGNALLPWLARQFRASHPEIELRSMIANGSVLQEALMNNRLDLALLEGEVSEPELHVQMFSKSRLLPILPPGHPLAGKEGVLLKELAENAILLREEGSVSRGLLNHVFALHGVPLRPLWECASTQAIVKAVHAGIGISILPEQLVENELREGYVATCSIGDAIFYQPDQLVWHQDKHLTGAARDFIAACMASNGRIPQMEP